MATQLPDTVVRFIAAHIDSASLLDALLLLRAAPDKAWRPDEVARALVTRDTLAAGQLHQLEELGLATVEDEGFRFSPGAHEAAIDQLADCYARRRHTVVGVIYGGDSRTANALADAFRIRKRKI